MGRTFGLFEVEPYEVVTQSQLEGVCSKPYSCPLQTGKVVSEQHCMNFVHQVLAGFCKQKIVNVTKDDHECFTTRLGVQRRICICIGKSNQQQKTIEISVPKS